MKKSEKIFERLIRKYVTGKSTPEEENFLNMYYDEFEKRPEILEKISTQDQDILRQQIKNNVSNNILNKPKKEAIIRKMNGNALLRAAVITGLILAAGIWYFTTRSVQNTNKQIASAHTTDTAHTTITPGGNKATLTLADGSTMVLDGVNNGAISTQGNVSVVKSDDGELTYHTSGGDNTTTAVQYNTITTPRGGQYQVILQDGTKVWLNAESSLRFPAAFVTKERNVELKGEAYFEVAPDKSKPFTVRTGEMTVKVLGTHFNINAYQDENQIKTTLFEGKVEVENKKGFLVLMPGQQAVELADKSLDKTNNADLEGILAWKNGYFSFRDASLQDVMKQISRWYDVDVDYEGNINSRKFGGEISRKSGLNSVLKILEESNIHFKVEGRKVVVTP